MNVIKGLTLAISLVLLAACGGGGGGGGATLSSSSKPAYTLKVSGGTLNDGTGSSGLVLLATLRDSQGTGPGLSGGWHITITGPGIAQPLSVSYDDGAPCSYEAYRWPEATPSGGTYTATASNGTSTLTATFSVNAASTSVPPPLSKNGNTISWTPVSGAGSYYYVVTDGTGSTVTSSYIDASPAATSYSFQLPALSDGSYSVEVLSHTESLPQLGADPSAAPALPSQENVSVATLTFAVAGGVSGSYHLSAQGGVLYLGKDSQGVDRYGLVVWSSLLTSTGTASSGDWSVSVRGPNISTPVTFTYPATDSHYVYWDYGTVPAAGTYTLTATASGSAETVSAQFSIPDTAVQLPVVSGIAITAGSNSYNVNWNPVTGAASYYVNLWAMVGGVYTEVAGNWVNGSTVAAAIPKNTLTKGTTYDVYVTSCTLDMTTAQVVPPPAPSQVNMSDNTYSAASFTAQ